MNPEFLTTLFTLSFGFGAAATILGFLFGFGHHGPFHLGHGAHVPHHIGGHASTTEISPFNFTSIFAFLIVFGAVGLAAQDGVGALLALLLAAASGLVAGWVAFVFLARFLVRGQTLLADEPIEGTVGRVSATIGPGRVGEVMYTRNGVRRSDGARSIDGLPIGSGEDVVIVGYKRGLATVQRWRDFVGDASPVTRRLAPESDVIGVDAAEPPEGRAQ
jgi:hypothetical protein